MQHLRCSPLMFWVVYLYVGCRWKIHLFGRTERHIRFSLQAAYTARGNTSARAQIEEEHKVLEKLSGLLLCPNQSTDLNRNQGQEEQNKVSESGMLSY